MSNRLGQRAADQIYETLRREIVDLVLPPGETINRAALQERFGVSSTPVRDALTRLSEEELVDIVAQSATRVSLIEVEKAREAQFLRRALEQEAVETICRSAERSVVIVLGDVTAEQAEAAEAGDLVRFDRLDRDFHRRLFEAANVPALHAMSRRKSGHIDRIRRLHLPQSGRMHDIIEDHRAIARAIAEGDPDRARRAMRDHLSKSLAFSGVLRERHPGYFA